MLGCPGLADGEETRFGLGRRHPGQRAHLGIRELAARKRPGQSRQRGERACDADALARGAGVESHTPRQPVRARAKAGVPPVSRVELADQIEQVGGGGIEGAESSAISSPRRSRSVVVIGSLPCADCTPRFSIGFRAAWRRDRVAIREFRELEGQKRSVRRCRALSGTENVAARRKPDAP
jgi:hypothetical protein